MVVGGFQYGKGVGGVHVGDAVRHQDDVVVGVRVVASRSVGKLYSEIKSRLHVRGVMGGETVD